MKLNFLQGKLSLQKAFVALSILMLSLTIVACGSSGGGGGGGGSSSSSHSGKGGGGNGGDGGGSVSTTGGLPGAFVTVKNNANVNFDSCRIDLNFYPQELEDIENNLANLVSLSTISQHDFDSEDNQIKPGKSDVIISASNTELINTWKKLIDYANGKASISIYCSNETYTDGHDLEYEIDVDNISQLADKYVFTIADKDKVDNSNNDPYKYIKYDDSAMPKSAMTYTINIAPALSGLKLYGCSIDFDKPAKDYTNNVYNIISDEKTAMVTGTPHQFTKQLTNALDLFGMNQFVNNDGDYNNLAKGTFVHLDCYDAPVKSNDDQSLDINYTVSGDIKNGLSITIDGVNPMRDGGDIEIANNANKDFNAGECSLALEANGYNVSFNITDTIYTGASTSFGISESEARIINKIMSIDYNKANVYVKCGGTGPYYYSEIKHDIRDGFKFTITENPQDVTHLPTSANVPTGSKYAHTITGTAPAGSECKAVITGNANRDDEYYITSSLASTSGYLNSKLEAILDTIPQDDLIKHGAPDEAEYNIETICKNASGNIVSHSDAVPFANPVTINLVAGAPTP